MRSFSEKEQAALTRRYRAGVSLATLASDSGISTSSMSSLFDTWGVLKRRGRSQAAPTPENNSRSGLPTLDRELAVKLYARQGLAHVAAVLGVSPGHLRKRFVEWGVHIRNEKEAWRLRAELEAEARDARARGAGSSTG
ncbi:AraC-like DNA-binding protein [Kitasatospora sp. MAA4]|uniref:hypothetical protein n=1 Tax=Kitasatospora sp. MAA4 TaxID=3035093 RepID=UPI002474A025|nr:hypothetical protein [Kitasatospora sp. MAA4]MDH6134675.1 AraC-like DNA-binding protein [Kitasatospora sp. MAA4]